MIEVFGEHDLVAQRLCASVLFCEPAASIAAISAQPAEPAKQRRRGIDQRPQQDMPCGGYSEGMVQLQRHDAVQPAWPIRLRDATGGCESLHSVCYADTSTKVNSTRHKPSSVGAADLSRDRERLSSQTSSISIVIHTRSFAEQWTGLPFAQVSRLRSEARRIVVRKQSVMQDLYKVSHEMVVARPAANKLSAEAHRLEELLCRLESDHEARRQFVESIRFADCEICEDPDIPSEVNSAELECDKCGNAETLVVIVWLSSLDQTSRFVATVFSSSANCPGNRSLTHANC